MRKHIIRYGVRFGSISGMVCFMFFLLMYSVNPVNAFKFIRADLGLQGILIWASIWYFKRNNGGELHFYHGFSIGFITNIVGALVCGFLLFVLFEFVNPEGFLNYIKYNLSVLEAGKADLEKFWNAQNFKNALEANRNTRPHVFILDQLGFKQLLIPVITLVTLALRKV
ncbi:MAG: DUF4199 domain-containing protein [Leadbetterella sp.]